MIKKPSEKPFHFHWRSYPLRFNRPIRTSRGSLSERKTFFLISGIPEGENPSQRFRIGEVGFLPGLTIDDLEDYSREEPKRIQKLMNHVDPFPDFRNPLFREAPALLFAWEMLFLEKFLDNEGNDFSSGKKGIPINGLVWMGDEDSQRRQLLDLLDREFTTLKLKIGGLHWDRELSLLRFLFREAEIREITPTVRLDANGAFSPDDALSKLEKLSSFPIHSIEQPLPPLWKFSDRERETLVEKYQRVFRGSPLPIALDEELIGVTGSNEKQELLDRLQPHYLVLKPGIHGGFSHCEEWIRLAEDMKMGWWITSALESNLGLTAIALWTASLLSHPSSNTTTQGLGTGGLYQNNFVSPLSLQGDKLYYDPDREKDMERDAWMKLRG